jgi:glucose dehydrogenase
VRARPGWPACSRPVLTLAASETTADRLLNAGAEPQNWLTHHKDYAATRYSTLDQIIKDNVKDLKVAWTFALGGLEGGGIWPHGGLEGTPIVEDFFIYVTDGWGAVYKLDATQGSGQAGLEDGSRHRQGLVGRGVLLRRQQSRRRAVAGQGDLAHPGRAAARDWLRQSAQERLSIPSLARTRLALDLGAQLQQREAVHEVANSEDRRNRVRLRNQRLLSGRSLSS